MLKTTIAHLDLQVKARNPMEWEEFLALERSLNLSGRIEMRAVAACETHSLRRYQHLLKMFHPNLIGVINGI